MNAIVQLQQARPEAPDPALLLAAVQVLPESLAIVASGLIVYANPAWCEMFECSNEFPNQSPGQVLSQVKDLQFQGRPLVDFVPQHPLSILFRAQSSETEVVPDASFVRTRSDGTRLHIEVARVGFHQRGNDFQIILARDISRQRHTEDQLRESQRLEAVGRLVGGVAHDFNNLLTGMMLYCDLLIGELEKDSRAHRHAEEMRMAAENSAALVQQLLNIARPPAGESRDCQVNDVVTGIQDLLTRLIGENIALNTSLAADLGAVEMEPAQVQQILLNLVLNARDAMPDGGLITVATRNLSDLPTADSTTHTVHWVELTVTDTGCGMTADTLDRAFDPFFTTKKPGRSSGLGLATARRLARLQGGSITAESEPGKGTRISLRLPRVEKYGSANSRIPEVIS
jgi:two-component system, cell cycle sensor histidine kinase and response regulator CckA